MAKYSSLEQLLSLSFSNKKLLDEAFTHRSANHLCNYERLEFLGDRILSLVIAHYIYERFSSSPEGILSAMVHRLIDNQTLSTISELLQLPSYIITSPDIKDISNNIKADLTESLIAVIYIEHGLDSAKQFIITYWGDIIDNLDIDSLKDSRSILQELCQRQGHNVPEYSIIKKTGHDHSPIFTVKVVCFFGEALGQAASKKEAYRQASQTLLESMS